MGLGIVKSWTKFLIFSFESFPLSICPRIFSFYLKVFKFYKSDIKDGVYNIGGGPDNTMSLLEFIDILEKLTGFRMKYKFSDWRPSDQKVYISDISKVSKELNWKPKLKPGEGVELLTGWVKENKELFK